MSIDLMSLFTPVDGRMPSLAEVEARAGVLMARLDDELIPGREDLDELIEASVMMSKTIGEFRATALAPRELARFRAALARCQS